MSMATAYGMRKKMAQGGMCTPHGKSGCAMCHGGKMAEGGEVKGVHQPAYTGDKGKELGHSTTGNDVRSTRYKNRSPFDPDAANARAKEGHAKVYGEMQSMRGQDRRNLAEGGFIEEEKATGYEPMPEEHEKDNAGADHEDAKMRAMELAEDLVGEIMAKKYGYGGKINYSEGGAVANDTPIRAGFKENDFDVLPGMEDTEANYTGANSGDEIGDEQEDEDRDDIVAMAMKSWKKKDRLPRPA